MMECIANRLPKAKSKNQNFREQRNKAQPKQSTAQPQCRFGLSDLQSKAGAKHQSRNRAKNNCSARQASATVKSLPEEPAQVNSFERLFFIVPDIFLVME
jgi:hypothetical protein